MKTIAILFLIIFFVLCAGCTKATGGSTTPEDKTSSQTICTPEDYGNGVLYFPCVQADFGNSLSSYLEIHKEIRVLAMAANDYSGYGYTTGYFVVVGVR